MTDRLRIAPIVEGHGEVAALPILLKRIWVDICHGNDVDVLRPIRGKRNRLADKRKTDLERAVALAAGKLSASYLPQRDELILILMDADYDKPCVLGPELLLIARAARSDKDISCVIANVEYETWFVATAASLASFLSFAPGEVLPNDPESNRLGKGWVKKRRANYSETLDQPKMTAAMDLASSRANSPSFDKLCRELEKARNR